MLKWARPPKCGAIESKHHLYRLCIRIAGSVVKVRVVADGQGEGHSFRRADDFDEVANRHRDTGLLDNVSGHSYGGQCDTELAIDAEFYVRAGVIRPQDPRRLHP